ncbi:hypothetical protein P7H60_06430 [Vagococcus carniphilus]|uniref:hypothetical protein n=1 Tax=Vagococcus carniphilus TaxID=218144 RepID=UPI002891CB1A|nr:hypothetical protein [Vagococcus carniphilus]MDT2848793.1 hypothetical protein [Vagococcus carniphilus]
MNEKRLLAKVGVKKGLVKRTRQMQLLLYLSFLLNLILLTIYIIGFYQTVIW